MQNEIEELKNYRISIINNQNRINTIQKKIAMLDKKYNQILNELNNIKRQNKINHKRKCIRISLDIIYAIFAVLAIISLSSIANFGIIYLNIISILTVFVSLIDYNFFGYHLKDLKNKCDHKKIHQLIIRKRKNRILYYEISKQLRHLKKQQEKNCQITNDKLNDNISYTNYSPTPLENASEIPNTMAPLSAEEYKILIKFMKPEKRI